MDDFIDEEFAQLDLGDKRLDRRFAKVLQRLVHAPMASIKSSCRGWAETMGAYRFFNHKSLDIAAIQGPHQQALLERAKLHDCVAVIQDTTELDFSTHKKLAGAGPLNSLERRGFLMHSQYVVSDQRIPLGLWDTHIYARKDEDFRKKKRKQMPIEEKESFRWVEGYRKACQLAEGLAQTQVVSVSDREGDIFELYELRQQRLKRDQAAAHWIVRANQDRALCPAPAEEGPEALKLFGRLREATEVGIIEYEIKAREQFKKKSGNRKRTTRSARSVKQRLRCCEVTPRPPYRPDKKLKQLSYWAVLAEEIDPPEGEDPIEWILLSSLPAEDFPAAQKIVELYLGRWDIEVFHRVLKTGCRVEEVQLKTKEALLPCVALYAIIAWRILYLTQLGRQCPDLPCGVVFEEIEWKAAVAIHNRGKPQTANPPEEPSLSQMIRIVAQFGGYLGRNSDPPPGAQSLWQGMTRLKDFALAWQVMHDPQG